MFLCEASYTDGADNPPNLHLTGREAGEIASKAGVGRLVLTHLVTAWGARRTPLPRPRRPTPGRSRWPAPAPATRSEGDHLGRPRDCWGNRLPTRQSAVAGRMRGSLSVGSCGSRSSRSRSSPRRTGGQLGATFGRTSVRARPPPVGHRPPAIHRHASGARSTAVSGRSHRVRGVAGIPGVPAGPSWSGRSPPPSATMARRSSIWPAPSSSAPARCRGPARLGLPAVAVYQTDLAGYAREYRWAGPRTAWRRLRPVHAGAAGRSPRRPSPSATLVGQGVEDVRLWRRGVDAADSARRIATSDPAAASPRTAS